MSATLLGGLVGVGLTQWLVLVLTGVLIYYAVQSWKYQQKYSHIPGPFALPIFGHLFHYLMQSEDIIHFVFNTAAKYNGFAKAVNGNQVLVLITEPDSLKTFYSNSNIDRTMQYRPVEQALGEGSLFGTSGERWKKLRKMLMISFQPTPISFFFGNFYKSYMQLRCNLEEKADGSSFACGLLIKDIMANSILRNSVGENYPVEKIPDVVLAFEFLLHTAIYRQISLLHRPDIIFYNLPIGRKFLRYRKTCVDFSREIVQMKKKELAKMVENNEEIPNLYIFNLLRKYGDEPEDLLTLEMNNMVFTGFETVSNTLSFLLIICGLLPDIQERIREEDAEIVKSLKGNPLTVEDLEKYDYLTRVIKETLRLFPIAAGLGKKMGEDTYFGKYFVPKGTDVGAFALMTYRNPNVFKDPMKFDPDRFLPENAEKLHPFAFNPFSAGPRSCPGARYAYIALKTVLPAILRDFTVESHYCSLDELFQNIVMEVTLNDKNRFPIKLTKRDPAKTVFPVL